MKKVMALLLAMSMLFALLSGCQSQESTQESQPVETSSAETAAVTPADTEAPASASPSAEAAPPTEDVPADAVEDAVTQKVDYGMPLFEQTASISIFFAARKGQGGYMPGKGEEDSKFWYRLAENLNISFEWTEPSESAALEMYNLMIASGDMTDIISEALVAMDGSAYTGGYDKAIDDDVYLDIAPLIEEYAPNYYYWIMSDESIRKSIYTDTGKLATFKIINAEDTVSNMGTVVNKAYLDATGLDIPDTVDGWLEFFAAMKANGVAYPCDVSTEGSIMNGGFGNAIGTGVSTAFVIDAVTGDFIFDATSEAAREYIEIFRECYANGYIDSDFMAFTGPENPKFNTGEIATKSLMGQLVDSYDESYGITVVPCPVIRADGAKTGQTALTSIAVSRANAGGGMAISTDCDDVEGAMRLLDWFYSDEGSLIANYGWVEGETYYVDDGKYYCNDFYQARSDLGSGNKSVYTADGDLGLIYPNISYDVAGEAQKEAGELWTSDTSGEAAIYYTLPASINLTVDESERISSALADIDTYIETTIFSWYCLETELNDSSWDVYVSTVSSMGLDKIREVYEAAYARYLDR